MTWIDTVPTIVVAALVIFVPGAILGRALGARGLAWLAASAPLTVSLVAVGTLAAGAIGLKWNPAVLGIFTLASSAVVLGVRKLVAVRLAVVNGASPRNPTQAATRRAGRKAAGERRTTTAVIIAGLGGLAFGVTSIWVNLTRTFIVPENISQTYDNVHHLSAIRAILESGNGSALSVSAMIHNGLAGVYPYAWHNLVALTVQLTNVSLPVAVNAVNIVIGALVWTVACMFLATRVAGTRPAVLLLAGALAGGFGAFPFLALGPGVLYPNFLAIALLPTFIGLVADMLKLSPAPRTGPALSVVLLVVGAPGLTLAHPNIVMALAAFVIPMLIFWLVRLFAAKRFPWLSTASATAAVALYLVVFAVAWNRIRPSRQGSSWPPTQTIPPAIGEALATSPLQVPLSWLVLVLTLLGIVAVCVQWRRLWALGPFLVGLIFFVVVSGFPAEELRNTITGVFFNDSHRLAALLPVMALPLMVAGAVWLFDLAVTKVPTGFLAVMARAPAFAAVGIVAALAVGLAAQNSSVQTMVEETSSEYYASTPDSWLLSSDEAALIQRAPVHIPDGATVIGHPANGGSLIYALEGYKTIMPSLSSVQSAEIKTIWAHLPKLNEDPAVCDAIRTLDAYYVLDFGSGRQVSDMRMTIPSSTDLEVTPGLTLLDEQGGARLYKIEVCQ